MDAHVVRRWCEVVGRAAVSVAVSLYVTTITLWLVFV